MSRLDVLDLSLRLSAEEEAAQLTAAQERLLQLRLLAGGLIGDSGQLGPPLCVLFEGWDASGKGGCIRRLASPLDPRHVRVAEFGPPSADERRHHFLHRFSPAMPGWGGMAVLDRSWYGRVLVERVEALASKEEWTRAYPEIVAWEAGLAVEGTVLVKLWLHVSEAEQLRRFRARERDPLKRWKLTGEDWRNLSRRADYEQAIEDMLGATDHDPAPWHVVAAESKPYARVKVLEIVIARIELAGFRDQLDRVEVTPLTAGHAAILAATWENVNVAPTYDPWQVRYELRSGERIAWSANSTLDLRRLLPTKGTPLKATDTYTLPAGLPKGNYTLAVQVLDPTKTVAPMRLADTGRTGDGAYPLGTVTVG